MKDKYNNEIKVNDKIIVPPYEGENMDIHCLGIWEVVKVSKSVAKCRLMDDVDVVEEYSQNEIIKICSGEKQTTTPITSSPD